jgi:hypothetical protein
MKIDSFSISNYKNFRATDQVSLDSRFNTLIGQNNAGKTSLLQILSLRFEAHPHRSVATVPEPDQITNLVSWIDVEIELTSEEILSLIRSSRQAFHIALPNFESAPRELEIRQWGDPQIESFVRWFFNKPQHQFSLRFQRGAGNDVIATSIPSHREFTLYRQNGSSYMYGIVSFEQNGQMVIRASGDATYHDLGIELSAHLIPRIYRFSAERMNVGKSPYGDREVLLGDASNLPEVLNKLQSNTEMFREFNAVVREILPQIRLVSVVSVAGENVILVWNHDPATKRRDLAIPLNESGTGIGQVLAILYVAITSPYSRVILVDEPQSFLHPGAARKLIEVLKRYSLHQFVISTHSPAVVAAGEAPKILIVRSAGTESVVTTSPISSVAYEDALREVGAKLSDVFGYDQILWVEGPTEEKCFPQIISKLIGKPLMGIAILPVHQTGDLESGDSERVFAIYRRLSGDSVLLPPAVAFLFDQECRSPREQQELLQRSDGKLVVLPRRMYENYLLNAHAIAAVANSIEGFHASPIAGHEVQVVLDREMAKPEHYCDNVVPAAESRIKSVNAAKVLNLVFSELSQTRVAFRKTKHGPMLTAWIIENMPDQLAELAELLNSILFH